MSTDRVPDLHLERLHLGELPPAEADAVRRRLAARGELSRLDALAVPEPLPDLPDAIAARIAAARARAATARRVRTRSFTLAVTAASFAVMALVVAQHPATPGDPSLLHLTHAERAKGEPAALLVYRQRLDATGRPRGHELLTPETRARPGDTLQLAVRLDPARATSATRLAVYSIDPRRHITEHLAPRPAVGLTTLELPDAFVLDDAPRFERFFLLVGDALDPRRIRTALMALGDPATSPLSLPRTRVVSRVVLKAP